MAIAVSINYLFDEIFVLERFLSDKEWSQVQSLIDHGFVGYDEYLFLNDLHDTALLRLSKLVVANKKKEESSG